VSKNIDFVDLTTPVPSDYLDDLQEGHTGSSWGVRLAVSGGNSVVLSGDALTENQYSVRIGQKPRYGTSTVTVAGGGGAGARDIYLTSANVDAPKAAAMAFFTPPATPATAFYRKVGELTWSGTAVTNLRLTNGVQASADQFNNFLFQPLVNSSTPLTVKGLASQSADILRVEDSAATAILRVTATSVIFSAVQTTGASVHGLGTQAAPSMSFTGDLSTGIFSPGAGRVAIGATNTNNFEVAATPAILIGSSTLSTPLTLGGDVSLSRGAANRLDLASGDSLNLVSGSLLFGGTALQSSNLSDSGTLLRTSGGTLSGAVTLPAGAVGTPSVNLTGAPTSGLYSPGANQVGIAANALSALTASSTGLVALPQATSSTVYLQLGSGARLYSGSGSGVTQTTTDALTVMAQDLEVRKSDGASRLILSRPDGTRVALTFDNANGIVITPL
jgi:hypothetical protein